jgi:hypothetical protein
VILNKKLNLVIPIDRDDGSTLYVHSVPISRETFVHYWRVMTVAFQDLERLGNASMTAPKTAMICLEEHAKAGNVWEGDDGVEHGLLGEIRRLTNVILPGPRGWETMMLTDALSANLITQDDIDEVEGAIVFFTLSSALAPKAILKQKLDLTNGWWASQATPLNSSEFARGLPTLTATGSTGVTAKPSSTPV